MRYERKIPIICPDVKIIRHQVRLHPAGFREIYHSREINNIYFETPSLDCGLANVEGERNRWKIGGLMDSFLQKYLHRDLN